MSNDAAERSKNIAIASLALRVALATAFLSAVADRFGLWGPPGTTHVSWGEFGLFLDYTALLLWFLPTKIVPWFGWTATGLEVVLAIGLLSGYGIRWFAIGSSSPHFRIQSGRPLPLRCFLPLFQNQNLRNPHRLIKESQND